MPEKKPRVWQLLSSRESAKNDCEISKRLIQLNLPILANIVLGSTVAIGIGSYNGHNCEKSTVSLYGALSWGSSKPGTHKLGS